MIHGDIANQLDQLIHNLKAHKQSFVWNDAFGKSYPVGNMDTHHLFYSVRMLWNHLLPAHVQMKPFKKKAIGNPHSEYWKQAMAVMWRVLLDRKDITPKFQEGIDIMRRNFDVAREWLEEDSIEAAAPDPWDHDPNPFWGGDNYWGQD